MMTGKIMMRLKQLQKRPYIAILIVLSFVAAACSSSTEVSANGPDQINASPEYGESLQDWAEFNGDDFKPEIPPMPGYEPIVWEDLVPAGFSSDEIYAKYADQLASIEAGSPEANALYEEMQGEYDGDAINVELDGEKIQLAGFISPLNYDDDIITEFLFVPYFGACIHVPAPPANQTILVTVDKEDGFTIEETYGSVWIAGTISATSTTTDLATANYTIAGDQRGIYEVY